MRAPGGIWRIPGLFFTLLKENKEGVVSMSHRLGFVIPKRALCPGRAGTWSCLQGTVEKDAGKL